MERKAHTVGGDVGVGLEIAVPETDGALERRHGVLGPFAGTAAVGEGEGTRVVQEGPGVRGHDERLDRQRRQAWTAEVRSLVGAEELAVLTSDDRAAD